jgi:hypothetical protein
VKAAERRALLGDDVIADIHERVAVARGPVPEDVLDRLRRILAPAMARVLAEKEQPAADADAA